MVMMVLSLSRKYHKIYTVCLEIQAFAFWRRGVTPAVKCAHAWCTAGVSKAAFYHLYNTLKITELCLAGRHQPRHRTGTGLTIFILCSLVLNIWNSEEKDPSTAHWFCIYVQEWGGPPTTFGSSNQARQKEKAGNKMRAMVFTTAD